MSGSEPPRRVIRCAPPFKALVCLACVSFVVGFAWSLAIDGLGFTSVVFLVLSAIGLAGVLQVFTTSIRLEDGDLVVTGGWKRRRYPRHSVKRVTWARGCPASIEVEGTGWVHLPETGHGTQGVANSVRAWLKRGGASGSPRSSEREPAADEGAGTPGARPRG